MIGKQRFKIYGNGAAKCNGKQMLEWSSKYEICFIYIQKTFVLQNQLW